MSESPNLNPKIRVSPRRNSECIYTSEFIIKGKIAPFSEPKGKKPRSFPIRSWQRNISWKRVCSNLQIHGIQISQLEVHQERTINALWKSRRIFFDEQKIEFLRGEMPEWIETKMQRPFRLWHEKKELYLPSNECERYDALFVCRSAAADACEGEGGSNGQSMEAEIFPIRPEFSTNALQAILLVIKRVHLDNHVQV